MATSSVQGATNANPFLTEFPLPQNGSPRYLIQHDGRLWFTAPGVNAIGSLVVTSTVDYTFTFYPIPTVNSDPYDLAASGNTIWFTERAGNRLGELNITTGDITEHVIPTPASAPTGIAVANNGVWFVQQAGNHLARFTPGTAVFDEYFYDQANATLADVATTSVGNFIWFTAPGVNKLVGYDVDEAEFYNISTVSFGQPPYTPGQVALDAAGNPWISTHNGMIGRYSPATVQFFRWYRVSETDSQLDGLVWQAVGSGNRLWFTESNTGYAGQLTTKVDGTLANKWRFPIHETDVVGIVAAADGTVWIADSGAHSIWRWSSPYIYSLYNSYVSVTPLLPGPGDWLTYTIHLDNLGPTLPSAVMTDTLPAQVTYFGNLSATSGSASYDEGVVTWQGPIAVGEAVVVQFSVTVDAGIVTPTPILNTVYISDGVSQVFTRSALVIANGLAVYLPVVLR